LLLCATEHAAVLIKGGEGREEKSEKKTTQVGLENKKSWVTAAEF
jgi:hypothetical protein